MFHKILVPLERSETAEGILPHVSDLARALNAPVLLLTVLDPRSVQPPEKLRQGELQIADTGPTRRGFIVTESQPVPGSTPGAYASQIEEKAQEEAKGWLGRISARLADEGVQVESVATFGLVAEEIVRVAEGRGCDLIAMATHGRVGLSRVIMGSVTEEVISLSHVPVLTIAIRRAETYGQEAAATTVGSTY